MFSAVHGFGWWSFQMVGLEWVTNEETVYCLV